MRPRIHYYKIQSFHHLHHEEGAAVSGLSLRLSAVLSSPPSSPPPPPRRGRRCLISLSVCCIIFAAIFATSTTRRGRRCLVSLCLSAVSSSPQSLLLPRPHISSRTQGRGQGGTYQGGGRSRVRIRRFPFLLLFDNQTISEFSRKRHFIKQQF